MKNYPSQDVLDHREPPKIPDKEKPGKKHLEPLELERLKIQKLLKEMK